MSRTPNSFHVLACLGLLVLGSCDEESERTSAQSVRSLVQSDTAQCLVSEDVGSCCPDGSLVVSGSAASESLTSPGGGVPCIFGNLGDDDIFLGNGKGVGLGGDGEDYVSGDNGEDVLYGGGGGDVLEGGNGDDVAFGGVGDDVLRGENGDDRLHGNEGADELLGGNGDDDLHGGPGDDALSGDKGDDRLYPGAGIDVVLGGKGDDVIYVGAACEVEEGEQIDGGSGEDTIRGPLSLSELAARGVVLTSVEQYVYEPSSIDGCAGSVTTRANVVTSRPGDLCVQLEADCELQQLVVAVDDSVVDSRVALVEGAVSEGTSNPLEGIFCFADGQISEGNHRVELTGTCADGTVVSDTTQGRFEAQSFSVRSANPTKYVWTRGEEFEALVQTDGVVSSVLASASVVPVIAVEQIEEGVWQLQGLIDPETAAGDYTVTVSVAGENGGSDELELSWRYLPDGPPNVMVQGARFESVDGTRIPTSDDLNVESVELVAGDVSVQPPEPGNGFEWFGAADDDDGQALDRLRVTISTPFPTDVDIELSEASRSGVQLAGQGDADPVCEDRCFYTFELPYTQADPVASTLQIAARADLPSGPVKSATSLQPVPPPSAPIKVSGVAFWRAPAPTEPEPINAWTSSYELADAWGPASGARVTLATGCGERDVVYVDDNGNFALSLPGTLCPNLNATVTVDSYGSLGLGRRLYVVKNASTSTTRPEDLDPSAENWSLFSSEIASFPVSEAFASNGGKKLGLEGVIGGDVGKALRLLVAGKASVAYFSNWANFENVGIAFTPGEDWIASERTSMNLNAYGFPDEAIRIDPGQVEVGEWVVAHEYGHVFHRKVVRNGSSNYPHFSEPMSHIHAQAVVGSSAFPQPTDDVIEDIDFNGKYTSKTQGGLAPLAADMHFFQDRFSFDFQNAFAGFLNTCELEPTPVSIGGVVEDRQRYSCERGVYDSARSGCANRALSGGNAKPVDEWTTDERSVAELCFLEQSQGWTWRMFYDLHDGVALEPGTGSFVAVFGGGETAIRTAGTLAFDDVQGLGSDGNPSNDRIIDVLTSYLGNNPNSASYVDRGYPANDLVDVMDGMVCRGHMTSAQTIELYQVMGYAYDNQGPLACP